MSVFRVILVRIFPHSDWARKDTILIYKIPRIYQKVLPFSVAQNFSNVSWQIAYINLAETKEIINQQNHIYRSSHQRWSVRRSVFTNFTKFTGKHMCQSLFLNKVAGLWRRCFPVNFLKGTFFTEHLQWLLLHIKVFCLENQKSSFSISFMCR